MFQSTLPEPGATKYTTIKLIAAGAAVYASLIAILIVTPARAGSIADAINGRSTGIGSALSHVQGQPQPQWQPTWISPSQPTWAAPPATRLQPPQRFQTTCYLIGNILECY
jgi:hypothetical protein